MKRTSIYGYTKEKPKNWATMSMSARYWFMTKYGVHISRQGHLKASTIEALAKKAGLITISSVNKWV